jgi:hypothetical protein
MSAIPGVPGKYLNAFDSNDGSLVYTGQYEVSVTGVPEEYLTCFNVLDNDQEMFDPTTAERESINVDLYDIANMEWEHYNLGEPSSDATKVEEPIIRQLMSFQEYQKIRREIEPMEIMESLLPKSNKREQQ